MNPFRIIPGATWLTTPLSVVTLLLCFTPARAAEKERANVLLLIVDDLNTWLLSDPQRYTGKVLAPHLQGLANEGVLFHNAHAASPVCVPSRTAFLSGVAPWKSGVSRNGVKVDESEALRDVPSIFQTFQDAGYSIASFGKVSHGYDTGVKYDASLNHKRDPSPPGAPLNGIAKSANGKLTERDWGATHLDERELSDTRIADATIRQLGKKQDRPFFIACGLFHPHYPWYVPQKYLDLYPLDEIVLPPVQPNDFDDLPPIAREIFSTGWDETVRENGLVKEAIRGYLASVSYSDTQMGRVLDALEKSPHRDETIVALMSDHGFHLGEKQQWSKQTLWEEATDSLLAFRVPGLPEPGQVCHRPVSLLDLYPTLAELAGIPVPPHCDGHSLLPLLNEPAAPWPHPAITVYDGHMAVRTEDHRFIRYWDGSSELYDRSTDPHEWTNQSDNPDFSAIKAELDGKLPAPDEVTPPLQSRQKGATSNREEE